MNFSELILGFIIGFMVGFLIWGTRYIQIKAEMRRMRAEGKHDEVFPFTCDYCGVTTKYLLTWSWNDDAPRGKKKEGGKRNAAP